MITNILSLFLVLLFSVGWPHTGASFSQSSKEASPSRIPKKASLGGTLLCPQLELHPPSCQNGVTALQLLTLSSKSRADDQPPATPHSDHIPSPDPTSRGAGASLIMKALGLGSLSWSLDIDQLDPYALPWNGSTHLFLSLSLWVSPH